MAVQIGAPPESGFDNPIGMLIDCHRRIEHFLHILCVVAEQAAGRALHAEEQSAIEASLHYFHVGGRRHTADEEESLFPRLPDAGEFSDIRSLESDHRIAGELHDEVERIYRKWMAAGALDQAEQANLSVTTQRLQALYQNHIRLEEGVVFPLAARTLDPETLRSMGEEFRQRRVD